MVDCILCGAELVDANISKEHIIPDALGGKLVTFRALCRSCNSKAGYEIDAPAIATFSWIANQLDVPRSRKSHPDFEFKDAATGLVRKFVAGVEKPATALNLSVERTEKGFAYKFRTNTREEGEAFIASINKKLEKRGKTVVTHISHVKGEEEAFQFDAAIPLRSPEISRFVAKIALSYAQHVGIVPTGSDSLVSYLRGSFGPDFIPPIGLPSDEVVESERILSTPSVRHQIYLFLPVSSDYSMVYIRLFEAFEWVALIECEMRQEDLAVGYSFDLVSAQPENFGFHWQANEEEVRSWISANSDMKRVENQFKNLNFWIKNRNELWVQRSTPVMMRAYFKALDKGLSEPEAISHAEEVAKKYLDKYFPSHDLNISLEVKPNHDDG